MPSPRASNTAGRSMSWALRSTPVTTRSGMPATRSSAPATSGTRNRRPSTMKLFSRIATSCDRLRVGQQLVAGFSVVLLLTGVVGGVALYGLLRVDTEANALAKKWLQGFGHLATPRAAVLEARDFVIKPSRPADHGYPRH